MKKYKLIRCYPGSPELGTVTTYYSEKNDKYYYDTGHYITDIPKQQVEDHPEFWEEVIEKDYDILSFKDLDDNSIIMKNGSHGCSEKVFLHPANTNIIVYSVKRLSDGEVFTIGDLITGCSFRDTRKIDSFLITDSKLYAEQCRGKVLLEDMKKYRKPLFTSTDGYPIYQGEITYGGYIHEGKDSFYANNWNGNSSKMGYFKTKEDLDKYFKKNVPIATTEDGVEVCEGTSVAWVIDGEYCYDLPLVSLHLKDLTIGGETYKIFSTRELAEEYLMDNKPSLSIQDVDNAITLTALEYALLKKFVKDKK